jgi:hypothetical protein
MATSPLQENPKNQTVANLDAWKKAGATIEPATNSGLQITPSKIIREDEAPNTIGSIRFSAKDAFKSSLEVNEEYSSEELDTIVDNTITHIRELAENGEMEANINVSNFNNGMVRELIRELKRRGFGVSRSRAYGLTVSWERRINWGMVGGILIVVAIIGSLVFGMYFVSKDRSVKPVQVESPR